MPERTWKAAFGEVGRTAARHKLASAIVTIAVVGSFAGIAWAGTSSNRTAPPAPAAAFSLPVLGHSGVGTSRVSLGSYAGKPLIVNFFASWCSPCKQETPLLARFYRNEHAKIAVVGMDENDSLANALKFTSQDGVSYPIGWDSGVVAASAYGVNALPQTFFLDARHRIVLRIYGAVTTADLNKGVALATGPAA